jgi:hypothetical protein
MQHHVRRSTKGKSNDRWSNGYRTTEREKLYFGHQDIDYYFPWIVGPQIYDGCDTNECMENAARIQNGASESWQHVWSDLTGRVEDQTPPFIASGDRTGCR